MNSPAKTNRLTGFVPELDGLRGVAIGLVLIRHGASLEHLDAGLLGRALELGWAGVDLFFVLSGFLITGILLETRNEKRYFRCFWGRRALRIFPLYVVFLFITFMLNWGLGTAFKPEFLDSLRHYPWHILYATNWLIGLFPTAQVAFVGIAWSLAIEEQFYIVWPPLVRALNARVMLGVAACLVIAAPVVRVLLVAAEAHPLTIYMITPARFDGIALGAVIALLPAVFPWSSLSYRRCGSIMLALGGSGMLYLLLSQPPLDQAVRNPSYELLGYSAAPVASAGVLGLVLSSALSPSVKSEGSVLRQPWLQRMGRYSYSIYLFHLPLVLLLQQCLFHPERPPDWLGPRVVGNLVFLLPLLAGSMLIGALSWQFVETRFLRLKRYFQYEHETLHRPAPPERPERNSNLV